MRQKNKPLSSNKRPKPKQRNIPIEQQSYKSVKRKADNEFSTYQRLSNADDNGYVFCCTCGTPMVWKYSDNGHYIPRGELRVRWDELNTAPQCTNCNLRLGGRPHIFRQYLIEKHGIDKVLELEEKSINGEKPDRFKIIEIYKEYKIKVDKLKKEKGLK